MPNYESYQVIKEITLDLVAPGLAPVVSVPQYDTKGRVVKVNLVSNSAAYEIESDFEVHAVMSKKDGKSVNNPCVVDGSTVYAVISKQMTVFDGRQMVAISITNNSDVELKAFPFVLNVIRAPSDAESYASEDEHLAFETTYKQVLEAKTAAENAAKSASDAAKKIEESAEKIGQNANAVSKLKEDKLDKPNNPVVGQFLRVKSISDTGEIVLETMAGGGGGGLPNGGTVGQVLAKKSDADGDAEWANMESEEVTADNITQALGYTPRKAWYVNVTLGNPITADKTAADIWKAYQDGYSVFAKIVADDFYPFTLPLVLPMGAEIFGFAEMGQLSEDSAPMTVCLAYNIGVWRFFTCEIAPLSKIPTALKNPNALTIKIGSDTVTYDGSSAETVEIADGTEVSY